MGILTLESKDEFFKNPIESHPKIRIASSIMYQNSPLAMMRLS